jgi:putative phosphoribosyl transferase
MATATHSRELAIPVPGVGKLPGTLSLTEDAAGLVIFAHGAGSSRLSPRNTAVAETLRANGLLGTLLFDLLTAEEDADFRLRFEIGLLAERLVAVTEWLADSEHTTGLAYGYFGASTGAAAALRAAAAVEVPIDAIVSRGGRPDLAADVLPDIATPTLLIVGGADEPVLELNRDAYRLLGGEKALSVVPGATHLFAEPGALEEVARMSTEWFERFLAE